MSDTSASGNASNNREGGGPAAGPSVNVLGQYLKDLSFENPRAPMSLQPREQSPPININVNVSARQLGQSEIEVTLTMEAKAGTGADVLRLGAAHLPSVPVGVMSTGFGKRNAFADLRTDPGRGAMRDLLSGTDIWIDAFRPGALADHGFPPERAAELHPGVVIVQISAFDWVGPWAGRRGFDSVVQSTTGVRHAGGEFAVDGAGEPAGSGPTGLPVQALDYATGFLAAGVAAQLLAHQRQVGGSWLARVSLLRTRNRLVAMGGPEPYVPAAVVADERFLTTVDSDFGRLTTVRPFVGESLHAPTRLGSAEPDWR